MKEENKTQAIPQMVVNFRVELDTEHFRKQLRAIGKQFLDMADNLEDVDADKEQGTGLDAFELP